MINVFLNGHEQHAFLISMHMMFSVCPAMTGSESDGSRLIEQYAPCPYCSSGPRGSDPMPLSRSRHSTVHYFNMEDCVLAAVDQEHITCPKHPKPVPLQERVPELFMTHFPSRYENSYTFNRLLTFFYIVTPVTVCIKWWKPAKNHKTRSQIKYNAHKGRSNSCCFPTKMMSLPGGWCHKGTSFC